MRTGHSRTGSNDGGRPVTVLITRRVRDGQQAAFERWLHQVAEAASRYPGHQGVTVVRPPAGDREYLIVFPFDTEDHQRAWEASEQRWRLLEQSSTLAEEPPHERRLTGLETWFACVLADWGGLLDGSPVIEIS